MPDEIASTEVQRLRSEEQGAAANAFTCHTTRRMQASIEATNRERRVYWIPMRYRSVQAGSRLRPCGIPPNRPASRQPSSGTHNRSPGRDGAGVGPDSSRGAQTDSIFDRYGVLEKVVIRIRLTQNGQLLGRQLGSMVIRHSHGLWSTGTHKCGREKDVGDL